MKRLLGLHFEESKDLFAGNKFIIDKHSKIGAFHLVNAYTISLASKDELLMQVLRSDHLICDSKPLSIIFTTRKIEHLYIRGVDLFRDSLLSLNVDSRHFLIGSSIEQLDSLMSQISHINEGIQIAGAIAPPYVDDMSIFIDSWIAKIKAANADIVWVAIGTPKQDFVIHELSKRIPVRAIGVGAAFDYVAGTRREAPLFFRKFYIEWLFRLLAEPNRLLTRYSVHNLRFLRVVFRKESWHS